MSNAWGAFAPGVASTRSIQAGSSGVMTPPMAIAASGTRAPIASWAARRMWAYCSGVPSKAQAPSGSLRISQRVIVSRAWAATSPASRPNVAASWGGAQVGGRRRMPSTGS